jgi:hypothetical protein
MVVAGATALLLLLLVLAGRRAIRALREFVLALWPH